MPASSRLTACFGTGSSLRRRVPLVADGFESPGWQQIWENGMWGGYLTAAADATLSRVRVDLYWPGVRSATIERVHANGDVFAVRGGDPATMAVGWARYDYEAPLDQQVYYRATSTERAGSEVVTAPLTLDSLTEAWLKHPGKPYLNQLITIRALGPRQRPARRSALHPPLRKYPIFVHGARQAEAGQIVLQVSTLDELAALNELLDDGSDLLLQTPSVWGGHQWYVSIGAPAANRLEPILGTLHIEHIPMDFDVTDRPPGEEAGGVDETYAALGDAYTSYNQVPAAYASYLDLSMATF